MSAAGTIRSVEAWPVNVPLTAPYLFAAGTYRGMSRTIVRVTTDEGVVGLGEGPEPTDAAAIVALGAGLVGRDVIASRDALAVGGPDATGRVGAQAAPAPAAVGLEMALWDVAARAAGVPLHVLLGGAVRREIAFSEYFAYRPGAEDDPAAVAASCAAMIEQHGATLFEGKVGVRSAADDLALVAAVRAAIGPDRPLRLDANMGWSLATATALLPRLEEHGIASVEEPVGTFAELAVLRASTALPFSSHTGDLAGALRLGVPDVFVLGVAACGGVAGTLRFVARCIAAGRRFWWYSGELGVGTAFSLQLAAAVPALAEPGQSLLRWYADDVVAGGPFAPRDGVVPVPAGPGIGVELDDGGLARAVERFARDGAYAMYDAPPLPRY